MIATPAGAAPPLSEIKAFGPNGPLVGTFLHANKPHAPVLLIHPGSGPTDRDGNNSFGIKANSYRLLAEALAVRGISTARIDKRGMFGSKAAIADANKVTLADYAADVANWIEVLRQKSGRRCIWVAGHSEGGLVALASAGIPDICGLVLISTPGRRFDIVLLEQLAANPANKPILDQARSALDALARGEHAEVSGMHPALAQGLFNPEVQDFLIDLIAHPAGPMIAKADKPILIVGGSMDMQVGAADAQALSAAQPSAKLVWIEGMSHTLKHVEDDERDASLASYSDPGRPIKSALVKAIADFIQK
jgi:pimeloyl-ACP methyl ester carboxylesterase